MENLEIMEKRSARVKENPGKGKSGETGDQHATKRNCLFCTQVHFMKKELCHGWGKTCMACGAKNHFQVSSKCKHHSVQSERLSGTVNYHSRFVPKLSVVISPISDQTHPNVEWTWDSVHENAFEEIKRLRTQAPVLAYFDLTKELLIQCGASGQGLGAALLQEGRPLAYASRALSYTETRYTTIWKEMLTIVFALKKWHQYTYGCHITVHSDYKPLENIMKTSLGIAPSTSKACWYVLWPMTLMCSI